MDFGRLACTIAISLLIQAPVFAQSASEPDSEKKLPAPTPSSSFAPLDRWKTAVLAGDRAELMGLYTTSPPAISQTPQGKSQDPAEEATFWSALAAQGLSKLEPKILEIRKPQLRVEVLVLRVEMVIGSKPTGESRIVSAVQVWVQQDSDWRIYATQRSDMVTAPPSRLPEPKKPNTDLYAPPEQAHEEVDAALADAVKDHKRVILVFGGNWCFDCHVLDESFHSKEIAPIVVANYHVVHVNIGEGDKNLDLAKKYEVPLEKGVPSLAVLDPDGKLVYSQKQGEFESSASLGPEDVLQFLVKWKPAHDN
ncbi:MAG: thioredoxin family protein [Candidatus Acidiferrales bacterium]